MKSYPAWLQPFGRPLVFGLLLGFMLVSRTLAAENQSTMTICLPSFIETFDPTNHRSRLTQTVLKNIYESLTARGEDLEVLPELARSWEQAGPFSWDFNLKEGVLFHNGEEFTAEDVSFTFDRVLRKEGLGEGRSSPRGDLFSPVESVEVLSRYKVRFNTHKTWAVLPKMVSLQEIVSRKQVTELGERAFTQQPVGTGPFRVESFNPGASIALARFKEHRDFVGLSLQEKTSRVGRLVFEVEPRSFEQIARLKRGQVDLISDVAPSAVAVLSVSPGINVISMRATRSHYAEINCLKPPLNDRRVRQALNYAVDMPAVVDAVLLGRGQALPTVLQPDCFGYNQDLPPYRHDPAKARELLVSAGYPPERSLQVYSHVSNLDLANALALFFTKVGLKAWVRASGDYKPEILGPNAPWDLYVGSWGNSTLDPWDIVDPKFRSGGRGNYSGYANAEVDHLIEGAEHIVDLTLRAGYYHRIQEIIHQDAPMVFGFAAAEIYAFRKRVNNFKPLPTGFPRLEIVRLVPEG